MDGTSVIGAASLPQEAAGELVTPRPASAASKKILGRIFALLLIAAAIFLVLELAARAGIFPNERFRRRTLMNAAGSAEKVLILGDSFGVDFDGSAMQLLKENLAQRGVRTVNLSAEGSGPREHLDDWNLDGHAYAPNLILLCYYVGNDLTDTLYRDQVKSIFMQRLSVRLRESFFLSSLLDLRARRDGAARVAELSQQAGREGGMQLTLLKDGAKAHPDLLLSNLRIEGAAERSAWEKNKQALRALFDAGQRRGATPLLILIPSSAQVSAYHVVLYRKMGYVVDENFLTESRPQDLLNQLCREQHWHCLDLLPDFRAAGRHRQLYREDGDHWSSEGNALAFQLIRNEIEKSNLLAAAAPHKRADWFNRPAIRTSARSCCQQFKSGDEF